MTTTTTNLELEVLEALESVGDQGLVLRELRQFEDRPSLGGGASTAICGLDELETALHLEDAGLVRTSWKQYVGADAEVTQQFFFITDTGKLRLRVLRGV